MTKNLDVVIVRKGNSVVTSGFQCAELLAQLFGLGQNRHIIGCTQDIGLGQPVAPVVVEALWSISRRFPRDTSDYALLFIHAVRYLCACRKERGSSLLSSVTKRRIRDGEAFDLPDYVYDRHTIEGQRLGRGIEHFLTESAKVAPEADLGPDEALWRQAMEQELAERMKEEGEE